MKVKNSGNTDFLKNVFQIKFDILLTNNHASKGYIKWHAAHSLLLPPILSPVTP